MISDSSVSGVFCGIGSGISFFCFWCISSIKCCTSSCVNAGFSGFGGNIIGGFSGCFIGFGFIGCGIGCEVGAEEGTVNIGEVDMSLDDAIHNDDYGWEVKDEVTNCVSDFIEKSFNINYLTGLNPIINIRYT